MTNAVAILIFICGAFVGFVMAAVTIYFWLTRRIAFAEKAGVVSYRDRAYRLTRIDDGGRPHTVPAASPHTVLEEMKERLRERATADREAAAV